MAKAKALMTWQELPLGSHVPEAGSTVKYKTGDWRSQRPILDRDKCTYCRLCWVYCPEGAYEDMGEEEKYFKVDLDFCKGCGICANECPRTALTMVPEEV